VPVDGEGGVETWQRETLVAGERADEDLAKGAGARPLSRQQEMKPKRQRGVM
jgi:hypothetical protein